MNMSHRKPALKTLVAILAPLLLIMLAPFMTASTSSASPTAAPVSALAFRDAMRKLWEDHVTWTRLYIVSAVAGLPDTDATTQRLLQNQVDIGNAIKPYYGDAAGNQLTALLKDHILGAAALLAAAKAGDNAGVQAASDKWYANANDIATFLSNANPKNWPPDIMKASMKTHLDQTLAEAVDHLKGNYTADVADYDMVHEHILMMADTLSSGIIAQFPDQFTAPPSDAAVNLHLAMRKLWEDHITWTRLYIVSAVAGLPDTDATTQRLLQNQVDIGNAIKPYYGAAAGDQLASLLKDHILGAAALLTAAKARDNAGVQAASDKWYANANDIAGFLSSANPKNWPLSALQADMKTHLDQTLAEAVDHLKGNYTADVADYEMVHEHILMMADALSDGIIAQFPAQFGAAPAGPIVGMPTTGGAQSGAVRLPLQLVAVALVLVLAGWWLVRKKMVR
jgi:nicotinamidase-related amidase